MDRKRGRPLIGEYPLVRFNLPVEQHIKARIWAIARQRHVRPSEAGREALMLYLRMADAGLLAPPGTTSTGVPPTGGVVPGAPN